MESIHIFIVQVIDMRASQYVIVTRVAAAYND